MEHRKDSVLDILIVDDEWIERDGIRSLVDASGFPMRAHEAENGEAALEALSRTPIDIMITDIRMPFMDGITLARRARERYAALKIVFYTAYGEFEYARQAIGVNASGYLLKPMSPDALYDLLKTLTEDIEKTRRKLPHDVTARAEAMRERLKRAFKESDCAAAQVSGAELCAALCSLDSIPVPYLRYMAFELVKAAGAEALARRAAEIGDVAGLSALIKALEFNMREAHPETEDRIRAYIHEHYAEDMSLASVAARMRLSEGYLSSLFREKQGVGFVRYVTRVRMDHAKELLSGTDMNITQIASRVGYEGPSYFTQVFRGYTGMSPTEFRKKAHR